MFEEETKVLLSESERDACFKQIYSLPVDCSEKTKKEIDFLSKHNLVNTFTVAFPILSNKLM